MQSKLSDVYSSASSSIYDVIILTETWLLPHHLTNEIFDDDWITFRKDRFNCTTRGGGVIIAVRKHLNCTELNVAPDHLEQLWVKVKISSHFVYLCSIYIPPNSSLETYSDNISVIEGVVESTEPCDRVFIAGDFNLPDLKWQHDEDNRCLMIPTNVGEFESSIVDSLTLSNLNQISNVSNDNNRFLDLIFTDQHDDFDVTPAPSTLCSKFRNLTHHKAIELTIFFFDNASLDQPAMQYYDFDRADYDAVNVALQAVDWSLLDSDCDIDSRVNRFYAILQQIIESHFVVKIRRCSLSQPWLTRDLKSLRNRRNKAYKKFKRTNAISDEQQFVWLSMLFHNLNNQAYNDYVTGLGQKLANNPKSFWKFVNNKRKTKGLPISVSFDGQTSSSDSERCDFFAKFFESVYSPATEITDTEFSYLLDSPQIPICDFTLSEEQVFAALSSLDVNKGAGPDNIPPKFLRNTAATLSRPLSLIFEMSLRDGQLPKLWKISYLTPIHKSGRRDVVTNYRGIAKLSVMPKLFEKLICDFLTPLILPVLHRSQHGFIRKKSTNTNLIEYCTTLIRNMSDGFQTDVLYTDFSKAFDKVNHNLLLLKLELLGLDASLLEWLSSYLSGRIQAVKIGDVVSRDINVTSGVPQGSHLGPLLFLLFVNDITLFLGDVDYLMYADDLKVFKLVRDDDDVNALQVAANAIDQWCVDNYMFLNINKCNIITFTRKRDPVRHAYTIRSECISRVEVVKDLGVWLDEKLLFKKHLDVVVAKANSILSLIKRFGKEFKDVFVIKTLFQSLVLSLIEYGSVIWMPAFNVDINRLESIQKQFLLFCLRDLGWRDRYRLPPYRHRLNLLNMLTIRDRHEMMSSLFVYDVLNKNVNLHGMDEMVSFKHHHYNIRHQRLLQQATTSTIYAANSPVTRSINLFNTRCHGLDFRVSKFVFKSALRQRTFDESYR